MLRRRRTARTLRNDAAVALLGGDCKRAAAELSEAVSLDTRSAPTWSDLAAARLECAHAYSDPYDLVLALAAADRALSKDSSLPEPRYNRAAALGHMSLTAQALADWRLLIRNEHDPSWAQEAASRAAALSDGTASPSWERARDELHALSDQGNRVRIVELVKRWPQRFREHVDEEVLVSWAEAEASGRAADARRQLALASAIGNALVALNGERAAAETVAAVRRAAETSPDRVRALALGVREYGRGLALARRGDFAGATTSLKAARPWLTAQGCPLAGWTGYWIAFCDYQRSDYRAARLRLRSLQQDADGGRYHALEGKVLSLIGLIDLLEGHVTSSLATFESALQRFNSLREGANAAKLGALMASSLGYLGRHDEAWRRIVLALNEPAVAAEPLIRTAICEVASALALEEREPEIALWFQDEVLHGANAAGQPYAVAEAHRSRGAILVALGRQAEAEAELDRSGRYLEMIADQPSRFGLEGDIRLAQGQLARRSSPLQAIAKLDSAVRLFRITSYHFLLAQALYERALAESTLDQGGKAELDLAAAITESEKQRAEISPPEQRISFFDRSRAILDAMVSLQLDRRQPAAALRYSERAKARVLLDWLLVQPGGDPARRDLSLRPGPLLNASAFTEQLPPGLAIIEYGSLPDRLVIWCVRHSGIRVTTVAAGTQVLAAMVAQFRRSLPAGAKGEIFESSAHLYDLLLKPVADQLGAGERLVLVPDGALHAVSFALLRDRRTGHYLVQDHVISVAPSITTLLAGLRRNRQLARGRDRSALAVSDPEFSRELYPSLPRLPASAAEAAIGRLFPGSRVLAGRAATRAAFLQAAGNFSIVHFGGHAVIDVEYPLFSQLLFAPQPGDNARGVLHAGELLGERFRRTELAVLASCDTGGGRIDRTEGVESLARAFLAVGVPTVVASLWAVDDQATSDLFERFYRHLRASFDPARALQAVQTELLASGSPQSSDPRSWGAFEVIGGGG